MVTFLCVLKINNSDGKSEYSKKDVYFLKSSIEKYYTKPHKFYCLTDLDYIKDIDIIKLTDNFDGYWSKIELFKHNFGKTIYFDLDCAILNNIDWLDELELNENNFWSLSHIISNEYQLNSSLMIWKGEKKFIYDNFDYQTIMNKRYYHLDGYHPELKKFLKGGQTFQLVDQTYIHHKLLENNIKINFFDHNKINFYKFSTIETKKNLDVLFFTGFPKLKDCVFSNEMNTYILDDRNLNVEEFISNGFNSIFFIEIYNENLLNRLISLRYNTNSKIEILNLKIKELIRFLNSDYIYMLEFNKQNYINLIKKYRKELNQLIANKYKV